MSLAADTREAVRERPFLLAALRAGVVNYRAAADFLGLEGDPESVATALRRFADDLPAYRFEDRKVRVRMEGGVGLVEDSEEALLTVGGTGLTADGGSLTAVVVAGEVDPVGLSRVLDRLHAEEVAVEAAGVAEGTLLVAVPRRRGARALRVVEDAVASVPG